eukprot:TRINITY_DN636_c0_g1_i1.p1 TRINITY_DN636_c0_g1~~TRINITY_DN636_c0_g1_i1.p1  ORF type:complete len:479 (+),score=58.10 TRINITY_DN636_c0_g1_i1:77-1513(+)
MAAAASSSSCFSFSPLPLKPNKSRSIRIPIKSSASLSDPFVLEIAEKLEDSLLQIPPSPSSPLHKLRQNSSNTLLSKPWPSSKDEPFRFTDTSLLKRSQIHPATPTPPFPPIYHDATQFYTLPIFDGHLLPSSRPQFSGLPAGAYVGGISSVPEELAKRVFDSISNFDDGDLFWDINGVGAPDVAVVFVPAGCRIDKPLHLVVHSSEGGEEGGNRLPVSNPRVLVVVEKGGEVEIVEEYSGGGDKGNCYWANSVMEIVIEEGGLVRHSYLQRQTPNSAHIKWTFVQQGASSTYELIEISTGGKLSRHNLHIQQLGPDTMTELSTFHLCGSNQTQDLHSKLVLDHPRGYSRQLHKCIVAHSSGHAVFDGNIKVNRYAQKTDAGQLTRSLLMASRATANIKPNLQIIADDVKCSHGAAISDLEENQLFYFQARGVDLQTARNALIFSFGAEVMERLPYESLRKRVEAYVKELLAAIGALQ